MGTVVTIDCYFDGGLGTGETAVADAIDRAVVRLHAADRAFSLWTPTSAMSQVRAGTLSTDDAPQEVREVLAACREAVEASGGWFDPWAMPGGVDPTGYVKGWAARRAVLEFAGLPVHGAIVNAAGDAATVGGPAPGTPFRVGIVDPHATDRLAFVARVDGGIATSGTYERGAHLIDPHTTLHTARLASATVCGPDLALADALATALAVGGTDVLAHVEALEGYEALAIHADGIWHKTSAFPIAGPTASPLLAST